MYSLCVVLQEYSSPLRLAIEFKRYPVVDAFLDRHPDVKPGLRGHLELDFKDKVSQHSFVQRKEKIFLPILTYNYMYLLSRVCLVFYPFDVLHGHLS